MVAVDKVGMIAGGVHLDASTAQLADDIGQAILTALLERAGAVGVPLNPEMEQTLYRYLGLLDDEQRAV